MLRNWSRQAAEEAGASSFAASSRWIMGFKKRHDIVSRKVTGWSDSSKNRQLQEIEASRRRFIQEYSDLRYYYPRHLVWNFDQSGFNYEISNERTLSFRGDRNVVLDLESRNKNTHSYTIQATISRAGTLIGKLLLCLREPGDSFGPRVLEAVDRQVQELGNVRVIASRSGKMTRDRIEDWIEEDLLPEINRTMQPHDGETIIGSQASSGSCGIDHLAGPSWASSGEAMNEEQRAIIAIRNSSSAYVPRPDLLLLADSWGGHSNVELVRDLRMRRVQMLEIPRHTTCDLQPLDVGFFRQHKKFVKRIFEAAIYANLLKNVTSREGIINMQGLVWNQFSSPRYRDMILWAWRHTDEDFSSEELSNGSPPFLVQDIAANVTRSVLNTHRRHDPCHI